MSDNDKIKEVLNRSVSAIYPSREALEKALSSGKKLKIYLGVDPTGPHLHLGQLTNLLLLKKLQNLGHEIIFLIGDFTGRIGDPTDKLATRKQLTEKDVAINMKTFKEQVGRIINFSGKNAVKIAFNSKWLAKMTLTDWIGISANVTVQQMIERDMFRERLKGGKPIFIHEFFYPLMQGYDSVAMDVDMEIGGNDQTFNMLMGRHLMKTYKNKEKFVLTTKLLEHPKTGRKLMNKSEGGMINLDDEPADIFGKVMALDDVSIVPVAELCTEMPLADVEKIKKTLVDGKSNPRDSKFDVAEAVVKTIYGEKEAAAARARYIEMFSKKEIPEDLPVYKIVENNLTAFGTIATIIKAIEHRDISNSEARRLVEHGGFEVAGTVKKDPKEKINLKGGEIIRIGKKKFFRVG
ncbi:MAG: tyrosine--tRNA ligase [Patescibacteria group bacterium]|nr:tyrosine--tRNA ligase [Patescibacteria group bacterium]MDE2015179.1 tyrosine--tRNA ligase [Patescibacteria group bacterium]MDE2226607.1 tyrosine--tRNA ligase [Patescibacteria group bacterium]